jgi:hypothetical protein
MNWVTAIVQWVMSLLSGEPSDNAKAREIQAAAVMACGFLPMYNSVLQLLASAFPPAVAVSTVASAICSAVSTQGVNPVATLADMTGAPTKQAQWVMVNGVKVMGAKVK